MSRKPQTTALRFAAPLLGLALLLATVHVAPVLEQTHTQSTVSQPVDVGMVALLASPQKYRGKTIRTVGFMCLESEGSALYLHAEDYRYRDTENAFELELSKAQEEQFKSLSLKHVLIEGIVHDDSEGTSMYAGSIRNITRLEYWRPRGDIPAPPQESPSACSR